MEKCTENLVEKATWIVFVLLVIVFTGKYSIGYGYGYRYGFGLRLELETEDSYHRTLVLESMSGSN